MINRREFLQAATALSALPVVYRNTTAADCEILTLAAVIFDSRHTQACDFAARAALLGAPVRRIEADITGIWQDELHKRWLSAPAAIAGLTERPALFLLERLAWDHGLRVVFEAEHVTDGQGVAAHKVMRTGDAGLARELAAAGLDWPHTLADQLLTADRVRSRDFHPSGAALAAHPGEQVKLYSWIIAPRHAV